MSDVLERFHRTLVEEIRAQRPDYLDGPFTVAEIYQNLVPYGTHRDRIGVEMNGDYEDALLRMLAGEGEYLVLESEHALRDLRQELDSPNPNTGLYREFAAVDVRLNPARMPGMPAAPESTSERPLAPPEDALELSGLPEDPEAETLSVADLAPDEGPSAGSATEEAGALSSETPESCRWCRAELPRRHNLNFCPFCGTDIHVVPCPACGEELEPEWRFCIACGAEVSG